MKSPCEANALESGWTFNGQRVLVVDDDAASREPIRARLAEAGLRVLEAANGLEATEMLEELPVALVLMSLRLPVMDGPSALRVLRDRGSETPVVALVGGLTPSVAEQCSEAGFSGVLAKPLRADLLMELVARELAGRPAEAAKAPGPKAPCALVGEAPLISRLVSNPRMHRVLRKFPPRLAEQLETIEKALAEQDLAELARVAHALKGSAGTLGYDDFFEPSAELERLAKARESVGIQPLIDRLRQLERRVVVPESEE